MTFDKLHNKIDEYIEKCTHEHDEDVKNFDVSNIMGVTDKKKSKPVSKESKQDIL